jgi:hypothetical protein
MSEKSKRDADVRTERCDECGRTSPAYGFTSLISEGGKPARNLCPECYNHDYTKRAGLPRLETVDFDPIVRYDCVGQQHVFYFVVRMSTGLGIQAFELVDGLPGGYQFSVLEPPGTPVGEAHARLVRKIEAGIAVRYLESSDFPDAPSQNRLYLKGRAVNGRIDENEDGPTVFVDGRELTWEELGRCLSVCTGFNFRLECFDACESPEITPDPPRPNPVWWLPELDRNESKDRRHH